MKPGRPGRSRLIPKQEYCLLLLLGGMPQAAAARALGIHPNTVNRWVNHDRLFQSYYRERLQEVWDWQRDEVSKVLRSVMDTSMDLVLKPDMDSIEKGVRLFAEATRKLPPFFDPCPGDYPTEKCPHIPGQRITPRRLYEIATMQLAMLPRHMTEEESGDSAMRRLELFGHLSEALKE